MRSKSALLHFTALFLYFLPAASPAADDLHSIVRQAFINNPQIEASYYSIEEAIQRLNLAKTGNKPNLYVGGDAQISNSGINNGTNNDYTFLATATGGLLYSQEIFDGFKTKNLTRQAESGVKAAQYLAKSTEQDIILSVIRAYLNIWRLRQVLNVQKTSYDVAQKRLKESKTKIKEGEEAGLTLVKGQAEVGYAQAIYEGAKADLIGAEAQFEQYLGFAPPALSEIKVPSVMLPKSLNAAIALAERQHPLVMAAIAGVEAAEADVKVAEAEKKPTVSVTAQAGIIAQQALIDDDNFVGPGASIVGRIKMPIYTSGRIDAQINLKKAALGRARTQVTLASRQLTAATKAAWAALSSSGTQLLARELEVKARESESRIAEEQFNAGTLTQLEFQTIRESLQKARIGLISARSDRILAAYTLIAATGGLDKGKFGVVTKYRTGSGEAKRASYSTKKSNDPWGFAKKK